MLACRFIQRIDLCRSSIFRSTAIPLRSLPFDDACAAEYGLLRADLGRAGTPIGANDLMIAAIARHHDVSVVTHNVDEFSRVVGLRVEDWEGDV